MKFSNFRCILSLLCVVRTAAFTPVAKTVPRVENTRIGPHRNIEDLEQKTPTPDVVSRLLQGYGEQARPYRRNVFSSADWIRTRRPDRFINNILTTPQSGIISQIQMELTFIVFVSFFIVVWNDLFSVGWVDFSGVQHDKLASFIPGIEIPLQPFSLSGSALGLLLAFRTNVSYARWNEARTAWGKVINDSRSIMRMGGIWAKSYKNIDDAQLQRLGEAVCAFSRSLMNRTLPPEEDEENFKRYCETRITDKMYGEDLKNAGHRPTAALAEITQCLVDMNLNPLHQVEVEQTVTGLCDALGASERIFTSPVPTFYTRHTARFLAFWLLALPAALYQPFSVTWNHCGLIPIMAVLSGFMLGIEELATQMEEPFSILPMEKMCEGSIRGPVMEQVERSKAASIPAMALAVAAEPFSGAGIPSFTDVVPEPVQPAPVSGGAMSVEEMNRLWAQNSGPRE